MFQPSLSCFILPRTGFVCISQYSKEPFDTTEDFTLYM